MRRRVSYEILRGRCHINLYLLLHLLLQSDRLLLVFAPLVLEPYPNHARTQPGHLDELLLHESVRARIRGVAGPQGVQLLLVQDGANPRGFAVGSAAAFVAAGAPDAADPRLMGSALRSGVCKVSGEFFFLIFDAPSSIYNFSPFFINIYGYSSLNLCFLHIAHILGSFFRKILCSLFRVG